MRNRKAKDVCSSEAKKLLESVAVNYRTNYTGELIFYNEAPSHPFLNDPHTLLKVLHSNEEQKIIWFMSAPLYDVYINEFVNPYEDGIYHSFSNCRATKEILHSGTTHVAVGFVDLSILLWMHLKETSGTSEPLRFVGFEKCAFNIAKTLVIVEMLKRKDDGIVDAILQVWYSSCWSDYTLSTFKSSVNKVIIEKFSENRHVCLILEEWSRCDAPSLHIARKEWLQKIDDVFFKPVVNSALKSSRNCLMEYFLTGQLLSATVGSIVMFKSPIGRSRNESCFHSLNFKDLIDATKEHKNDFVSGAISLLRQGIIRLNNYVIRGLVVIKIEPPTIVSLDVPCVVEKIRCMKPYTISWNNCLDYMTIKDFHRLAKACSAPEDTIHYGYSMNWICDVKGACSLSMSTGEHFEEVMKGTRSSVEMQYRVYGCDELFISPPIDNPINILDITSRCMAYKHWVRVFFASVSNIGRVEPSHTYNPFDRAGSTLFLMWTYDESISFNGVDIAL